MIFRHLPERVTWLSVQNAFLWLEYNKEGSNKNHLWHSINGIQDILDIGHCSARNVEN